MIQNSTVLLGTKVKLDKRPLLSTGEKKKKFRAARRRGSFGGSGGDGGSDGGGGGGGGGGLSRFPLRRADGFI